MLSARRWGASQLLHGCGAKSGKTLIFKQSPPGFEFIFGQIVALTGFFQAYQAAAHTGHYFGFTANNPPFGARRRQVVSGHGDAGWPDYADPMDRTLVLIPIRFLVLHLSSFDL